MANTQERSNLAMDIKGRGVKQHNVKISTVVFMMFCLCSAGAYGIEEMIPEAGPGLTLIMLMILPFLWGIPLGLVAAELGDVRPAEGGYYKWVQEALGEYWGFQAGWWRTISIYIDNTLYVILAGGYIASQWDIGPTTEMIIKVTMILIFIYINIRGVKDVGKVSTILSVLVIFAFVLVAASGLLNWEQNPMIPFTADGEIMGIDGIGLNDWTYYIGMGIALGMWMYSGYESMSTMAGELEDPHVLPRATLLVVPLIMAIYILPTLAGLATLNDEKTALILGDYYDGGAAWEYWGTELGNIGYADVVTVNWGPAFGVFFVIVAVASQCSIYNTYITSASRGFFALADDYLAPKMMVKVNKKYGVPYVSVISIGVTNIVLCQFAFTTIVVIDMFLLVASYILIYISAMILRKRLPDRKGKFVIPGGYTMLSIICIVPTTIGFLAFFLNGTNYFIGGLIGIVTGPILYVIWKWMYGGLYKKDPINHPINPKTRLAIGDLRKMAFNFAIISGMAAIAYPWLMWFEGPWGGDWGAEYYLEEYGSGILSNFEGMLTLIKVSAVVFAIIAILIYLLSRKIDDPKKIKASA